MELEKLTMGDLVSIVKDIHLRHNIIVDMNSISHLKLDFPSLPLYLSGNKNYDDLSAATKGIIESFEVDIDIVNIKNDSKNPYIYVTLNASKPENKHSHITPQMLINSMARMKPTTNRVDAIRVHFRNMGCRDLLNLTLVEGPLDLGNQLDGRDVYSITWKMSVDCNGVSYGTVDADTEIHLDAEEYCRNKKPGPISLNQIYNVFARPCPITFGGLYRYGYESCTNIDSFKNKLAPANIGIVRNTGELYVEINEMTPSSEVCNIVWVKDIIYSIMKCEMPMHLQPEKVDIYCIHACRNKIANINMTIGVNELDSIHKKKWWSYISMGNAYEVNICRCIDTFTITIKSEDVIVDGEAPKPSKFEQCDFIDSVSRLTGLGIEDAKTAIQEMIDVIDDVVVNYDHDEDEKEGFMSYLACEKYTVIKTLARCDNDVYYVDSKTGQTIFYPQSSSSKSVFLVIPREHPNVMYTAVLLTNGKQHNIMITGVHDNAISIS